MSKIGAYNMKLRYDDMGEKNVEKAKEITGDTDNLATRVDLSVDSRFYRKTKRRPRVLQ